MARTMVAEAAALGAEHGESAAAWWAQEAGGGRDTRGPAELAAWAERVLAEVLDGLPAADLSGQWADGMTPQRLAEECGLDPEADPDGERTQALCDRYEAAFSREAMRAVVRHLRGLVRP